MHAISPLSIWQLSYIITQEEFFIVYKTETWEVILFEEIKFKNGLLFPLVTIGHHGFQVFHLWREMEHFAKFM